MCGRSPGVWLTSGNEAEGNGDGSGRPHMGWGRPRNGQGLRNRHGTALVGIRLVVQWISFSDR